MKTFLGEKKNTVLLQKRTGGIIKYPPQRVSLTFSTAHMTQVLRKNKDKSSRTTSSRKDSCKKYLKARESWIIIVT